MCVWEPLDVWQGGLFPHWAQTAELLHLRDVVAQLGFQYGSGCATRFSPVVVCIHLSTDAVHQRARSRLPDGAEVWITPARKSLSPV